MSLEGLWVTERKKMSLISGYQAVSRVAEVQIMRANDQHSPPMLLNAGQRWERWSAGASAS